MKNLFKISFLLSLTLSLTSCQFSENLNINEDGSGTLSIDFDGSGVMQMMGAKLSEEKEHVKMDTIFNFKEFMDSKKDSISKLPKDKQEALKQLENYQMKMQMDTETLKMNFSMFVNFDNVNEITDAYNNYMKGYEIATKNSEALKDNKAMKSKDDETGTTSPTKTSYSYTSNSFSRKTEILDKEAYTKSIDSLAGMEAFMGASKYKLNYHFAKKVKSVSDSTALFSADRKTITLEKSYMEYLNNPSLMDITIEFE